jgi:hypothetical protein
MEPNNSTKTEFPTWQRQYEALISETEETRLREKAAELEGALFTRMQELAGTENAVEKAAMQQASKTLLSVCQEKLGFPKWDRTIDETQRSRPVLRDLLLSKVSSTVTLAVCEKCNARFKCYLPNPDQAMWEITAWFDRHICKSWPRRNPALNRHPRNAVL